MDAQEARKKATDINTGKNQDQYMKVKDSIRAAAENGELKCYAYESLRPSVLTALTAEGFVVSEFFDQRDGTTVTISW